MIRHNEVIESIQSLQEKRYCTYVIESFQCSVSCTMK